MWVNVLYMDGMGTMVQWKTATVQISKTFTFICQEVDTHHVKNFTYIRQQKLGSKAFGN